MAPGHLRWILLLGGLLALAIFAAYQTPLSQAEDCILPPGTYRGTGESQYVAEHLIDTDSSAGDVKISFGTDIQELTLKVECDGRVTGTASGPVRVNMHVYVPVEGSAERYEIASSWGQFQARERVEGTIEVGDNGLPRFRLTNVVESGSLRRTIVICPDPTYCVVDETVDDFTGVKRSYVMQADTRAGDLLSGRDAAGYPSAVIQEIRALYREYFVSISERASWQLVYRSPVLESADAQFERFFLAGIPLANRFAALVDWKQSPEPHRVTFTLNEAPREGAVAGDSASATYDMGSDFRVNQANTLLIKAIAGNGDTSPPITLRPEVYAVPPWAGSVANFTTTTLGKTVTYRTRVPFPRQSFDLFVDVPSFIPIIGGRWGLSGTQLDVALNATSSGSPTAGNVSGRPQFSLGAKSYGATITGETTTVIRPGAGLDLVEGNANYQVNRFETSYTIGLLSLIPGLETAVSQTVFEDVVKAINGSAGVTASLEADLRATGTFDDRQTSLAWTEFSGRTDAEAKVRGNFSPPVVRLLVSFWVAGGVKGSLTISLAPDPKVSRGAIGVFIQLTLSLLGQEAKNIEYKKDWTFPSGGALKAAEQTNQIQFQVEERPPLPPNYAHFMGAPDAGAHVLGEQSVNQKIVWNAYLNAKPQLATGPNGSAALVWVHDDPTKPSQQGKEISVSLWNGVSWRIPIRLTADSHPDFAPAVAIDSGGNVSVLWMRHGTADLPDSLTLDSAYLAGFDIWAARFDATTRAWSTPTPLVTNNSFDHSPRVAAASDGTLLAVWLNNAGNQLVGTAESPHSLMYSVWQGSGWSAPTAIATVPGLLDWDVALNSTGTAATLVLARDEDGVLGEASDWELQTATWNGATWTQPTQATTDTVVDESPRVVYDSTNTVQFFWRRAGALVTATGTPHGTPQTLVSDAPPPTAVAAGPNGRLAVMWSAPAGPGMNIVGVTRSAGGWSQLRRFTSDAQADHTPSGGYLPTGDLLLGYGQTAVFNTTEELPNGDLIDDVPSLGSFSDLLVATVPGDVTYVYLPSILRIGVAADTAASTSASTAW